MNGLLEDKVSNLMAKSEENKKEIERLNLLIETLNEDKTFLNGKIDSLD
jgi:hypothetical protein